MVKARYRPANGLAVDLGGTKISASHVQDNKVVTTKRVATDPCADVHAQIDAIYGLLHRLGLSDNDAIGVAVAGRVSGDGEWFAVNPEILTRIDRVPLRKLLMERLGREVAVQNDAVAAAIGEFAAGAGHGCRSMAYVTVSTGVGGGIILDGRPVTSPDGLAGHVGFSTCRLTGGRCGSGRLNTVESVASGRAIAARAAACGQSGLDGKAVFEAHLAGESWARGIIRQSAAAVAELCGNLKATLGVDRVVIGGGIGLAQGYGSLVEEELKREPELFRPEVRTATLRHHSAAIGILAQSFD